MINFFEKYFQWGARNCFTLIKTYGIISIVHELMKLNVFDAKRGQRHLSE